MEQLLKVVHTTTIPRMAPKKQVANPQLVEWLQQWKDELNEGNFKYALIRVSSSVTRIYPKGV
jgi:hypothetical protein